MVRTRRALSEVSNRQEPVVGSVVGTNEGSECGNVEFTNEEVDALLNEKFKAEKFDFKGKLEQSTEHSKRLKLCIKWFQQAKEIQQLEEEKLRNALESAEKKCTETELKMSSRIQELTSTILELQKSIRSLKGKRANEESDNLSALECHKRKRKGRPGVKKFQASLLEDLEKIQQGNCALEKMVASNGELYKQIQEYDISLQKYNIKLQANLVTTNESLKMAEMEKLAIAHNLSNVREELQRVQGEVQHLRNDRDHQVAQVQILRAEIMMYQQRIGKSLAELESVVINSDALEETCSSQKHQICLLEQQLASAEEKIKLVDLSASKLKTEYEQQKNIICELQNRIVDFECQVIEGENLRKRLHNTILELKGNIRVFCRVRPLLPDNGIGSESTTVSYPTSGETLGRGVYLMQSDKKYLFTFDQVFTHEASQQDVFVEISQLVESALDGYKVCIFAYGQSGSGKTYTMMGKPEQKGLIPRSLEQIFQISQSLQTQGWKYQMQTSMLEIYNETIRDLLSPNRSCGEARTDVNAPAKQYTIKHDANGNTYVSDLTIADVCSIREVSSLLQQAANSRSVGKTQMNEQSSRSHFVFTLRISGVNESTEQQVQGVLNLIDLAGSGRLSKSGATGEILKETQAINKSLTSLGDVIFALASKKEFHVPYRNSKLTHLLQPCLGGDSKCLMIVNISTDPSSAGETLCALQFATRVNACEIGVPRRQTSVRP